VKRRSYTPCYNDYSKDLNVVTVSSATSTTFTYSRLIYRTALLINSPRAFFIGPALVYNKHGKIWAGIQILQEIGVYTASFHSEIIEHDYYDELQGKLDPTWSLQTAFHDYGFVCYIVNQCISLIGLSGGNRKKWVWTFIAGFALFLVVYTERMRNCHDWWYSFACILEFFLLPFGITLNQVIIDDMYVGKDRVDKLEEVRKFKDELKDENNNEFSCKNKKVE